MAILEKLDKSAEAKGKGIKTLWQFVKFIVVSLGACIVQVASLAILYNIPAIKELSETAFHWFVFNYPVIEGEQCGLALFIAFNVSNLLAQIVSFFINKNKTFNSNANTAIILPIYIAFTVGLLVFSAWLNPVVFEFCETKIWQNPSVINFLADKINLEQTSALSTTIATAVCCTVQFLAYFPFDKLIMREKKDKKAAEETK